MSTQATQRAVLNVVRDTIARQDVPADPNAALPIAQAVAPIIAHATNAEPWYQSRVLLGSIATLISSGFGIYALAAAGVRDGELYAPLVTAAIGALVAIYGRIIAKKPIGQ